MCGGKETIGFSFSFVLLLGIVVTFIIAYCITAMCRHPHSPKMLGLAIVFLILGLAGGLFVYVLLFFHIYLGAVNTTTNEFCKDKWKIISGNPFSKTNVFKNFLKIFGKTSHAGVNPRQQIVFRSVRNNDVTSISGS